MRKWGLWPLDKRDSMVMLCSMGTARQDDGRLRAILSEDNHYYGDLLESLVSFINEDAELASDKLLPKPSGYIASMREAARSCRVALKQVVEARDYLGNL